MTAEPQAEPMPAHDLGALNAGAMLREAREAAGLSVDAVSQQLKLAPRQVKALEDGEFALLPGRTFVRGFARNYARLVHLDPQSVLDALPGGAAAGGLEAPPLHPTTITMGELPSTSKGRPPWLRWAIPAVLIAAVLVALAYEYLRSNRVDLRSTASPRAASPTVAPAPTSVPPAAGNAESGAITAPPAAAPMNPVSSAPADNSAPAMAPAASAEPAPAADTAAVNPPPAAGAPLQLTLRGDSWVEVRDGARRVLLSQTLPAGQVQSIVGIPPFEVVIGNAPEVTVRYRGQLLDLAPYTRQNVARFTLQ